jgi:hypothetical protein
MISDFCTQRIKRWVYIWIGREWRKRDGARGRFWAPCSKGKHNGLDDSCPESVQPEKCDQGGKTFSESHHLVDYPKTVMPNTRFYRPETTPERGTKRV